MPYLIETLHIKLPKVVGKDRRMKLNKQDKIKILKLKNTGISQNETARRYNISRTTVRMIRYPEIKQRYKEQFKERRKDGRYYDREKHTKAMRDTRRRRYSQLKIN